MLIALIIVSIFLIISFCTNIVLFKLLKNTLGTVEDLIAINEGRRPHSMQTAYNDKYYPATVIASMTFGADMEGRVVDFSKYETHGIVGFTIMTKDKFEDYYGLHALGNIFENSDAEDLIMELAAPMVLKNVLVYEVREGEWMWKSAE